MISNSLWKEAKDSKDAEAQVEEEAEEDEIHEVSEFVHDNGVWNLPFWNSSIRSSTVF